MKNKIISCTTNPHFLKYFFFNELVNNYCNQIVREIDSISSRSTSKEEYKNIQMMVSECLIDALYEDNSPHSEFLKDQLIIGKLYKANSTTQELLEKITHRYSFNLN